MREAMAKMASNLHMMPDPPALVDDERVMPEESDEEGGMLAWGSGNSGVREGGGFLSAESADRASGSSGQNGGGVDEGRKIGGLAEVRQREGGGSTGGYPLSFLEVMVICVVRFVLFVNLRVRTLWFGFHM